MPRSKKIFHYFLLWVALCTCIFIYVDAYLLPLKSSKTLVTEETLFEQRSFTTKFLYTYSIQTSSGKFDVTDNCYHAIQKDDSIILQRSPLTRSLQKITVTKAGFEGTFQVGFVRARDGLFFVPFLMLGIIAVMYFYEMMKSRDAKNSAGFALLALSLILLFFHIGLSVE